MTTAATISAKLILDAGDYYKDLENVKKKTDGFSKTLGGLAAVGGGVIAAVGLAGAALGGMAISTGMAAAEVEQMTMVSGLMAENAGWSADMIEEQRKALRASGITAGGTEKALQSLMAAQLDVTTATDLSRLAQNLAVKTGEDSTQTFLALVDGIERADSRMLKSAGITVDLAKAQQDLADELGKTVGELTSAEKQQAAFNAVIEQSPIYDGLYEAAMEHPIKQLGSLKRLFNDVAVGIGSHFTPAISNVIAGFSTFVKHIIEAISEGGALEPMLDGIGEVFNRIGEQVGNALVWMGENISLFIEKVQVAWAWLQENEGVIVGIFAAIGAAIAAFVYTVIIPAMASVITALAPVIAVMALVGAAAYLLYEAWTNNWLGIRNILTNVWENTLKPAFETLVEWLQVVIPAAIEWLSDKWENVLLPAIEAVWDWLSNKLWPVFVQVADFLAGAFTSTTEGVGNLWNTVLKPAFEAVWDVLENNVFPIFQQVGEFLGGIFTSTVETLSDIWENTLKPALETVWDFIETSLFPVFEALWEFLDAVFSVAITALAGLWQNVLAPALETVFGWLSDKLAPVFEWLADFWEDTFLPALEKVAEWFNDKLAPALDRIAGVLKKVVDLFKKLTDNIKNINLPDWLTPGSPTPFEIGLRGISKALKDINRTGLPSFDNSLSNLSVPGGTRGTLSSGVSGVARAGERPQTVNNYNLTANYPMQRETDLITDLKIQEALRA